MGRKGLELPLRRVIMIAAVFVAFYVIVGVFGLQFLLPQIESLIGGLGFGGSADVIDEVEVSTEGDTMEISVQLANTEEEEMEIRLLIAKYSGGGTYITIDRNPEEGYTTLPLEGLTVELSNDDDSSSWGPEELGCSFQLRVRKKGILLNIVDEQTVELEDDQTPVDCS